MARYDVTSGKTSTGYILNGDSMFVSSGGKASNTTVYSSSHMIISSGGNATCTIITGNSASVIVDSRGSIISTTIESGGHLILSGGSASSTIVQKGGVFWPQSGGVANNTIVYSGGIMYTTQNTKINNTTINPGGRLYVSGAAPDILENGGYVEIGANAKVTFVPNTISRLILEAFPYATVHSGTTVSDAVIVADIYHSEKMLIYSGGKITGDIVCVKYANISAFDGAIVDFDLTTRMPNCAPVINHFSCIKGNPSYTITVNSNQYEGIYSLAEDVDTFNQVISIVSKEGVKLGAIVVGESVAIAETIYTLFLTDGTLSLKIGDSNTPPKYTSAGLVIESKIESVENNDVFHNTYIISSGELSVLSGGTAINTSIFAAGNLKVFTDAETIGAAVYSGGMISVFENGTAINTLVYSGGSLSISSNGKGDSIEVFSDGRLSVDGVVNNISIASKGITSVFENGLADNTNVTSGGTLLLFSGGQQTGQMFFSEGAIISAEIGAIIDFNISDLSPNTNARINNISLVQGTPVYTLTTSENQEKGVYVIAEGAEAFDSEITIQNALKRTLGTLTIGNPLDTHNRRYSVCLTNKTLQIICEAKNIGLNVSDKMISVSQYEIFSDTVVDDNGIFNIYSDGEANSTIVRRGGMFIVSGKAFVNNTRIDSSGQMIIYSGGKPTNTSVSFGGRMIVSSGGSVNNTIVESKGAIDVSENGLANNTTIHSGGSMYISSTGKVTGRTNLEKGTFISAYEGAIINFDLSDCRPENEALFNNLSLVQGTPTYVLTVLDTQEKGEYLLAEGATDFKDIITVRNQNGNNFGTLSVGDSLEAGNKQYILDLTNDRLSIICYSLTTGLIVANENVSVEKCEIYKDTAINAGGKLHVSSGGTANKTTINANMWISSGGIANDTTIKSAGCLNITFGGIANRVSVNSMGELTISSGGTATDIIASSGARMHFVVASNTMISGTSNGDAFAIKDGYVSNYQVGIGGCLIVESDCSAYKTLVNSWGSLYVSSAGNIESTTINKGRLQIASGGIANSTSLVEGFIEIAPGARANSTTVSYGGTLSVSSGGTALDIIEEGGCVNIVDGANISFVSNTFSDVILEYLDRATVHSGTTATNTTISSGGSLIAYSGGIVNSTVISGGGSFFVLSKGKANRTTVNAYGSMFVSSGGVASITTVQSNGRLMVSSGGIITDRTVFIDGAFVSVYTGGIVDFDISAVDPDASARFNTLSLINGTPTYTLTVSDRQMDGTYTLANHAEGFNEIITVQNSLGETLGTVSVDGKLTVGKACYSLKLSGNDLKLNISGSYLPDTTAPKISSIQANITTPTNQDVTISAVFTDNVQVTQTMYRLGLNGTWETYKDVVTVSENTTVYFKAKDAAGNESTVASYTVSNIDKIAPDKPTVSADITTLTNQNVNISAVFSKDTVKKEYKLNNGNWQTYSTSVKLTANGTVSFRGTDAAGNISEIASYTVDYIDKTAPTKPVATANTTEQTDQDVTVTATFSDDSEIKEYRLEGGKWTAYTEPVIFTENGTVYFRGTDAAGNVSEVTSYEVTNIEKVIPDTTPPTVSSIQANITALTNQDVVVTAQFDDNEELASAQYRIGEKGKWTLYTNGAILTENGTVYFKAIDAAGNESEVVSYTVSNIDKVAPSDPTGVRAFVERQDVALLWNVSMDDFSGVKEYLVTYSLNGQEFTARTANSNYVLNNADFGSYSWSVQAVDFAGNESALIAGDAFTVSGFKPYTVEYSADNFEHVITFAVTTSSLDAFRMPTGTYQMRVKQDGSSEWLTGDPIVAPETDIEPQLVKSDADSNADVFFANPIGTWESGYMAQHVGSTADPWGGTKEYASLYGKNKLADIIEGSTDANILLMTDDDNGDGLFVDDIYSALPGSVTEQQSRIAQIDEIRAGFGNDIVDMTSQRFEYIGEGLTIRGGEGNDIIWANKGDNFLFGDAGNDRIVGASGNDVIAGGIGNDRMHGGGGEDVFTFCENWGTDTVEQLADGSVLLWFASGSETNWNAETMTYTDGENSVKVTGVTSVNLNFGDDGSAQFATLAQAGAFFDATTERIFEEEGKGILASL